MHVIRTFTAILGLAGLFLAPGVIASPLHEAAKSGDVKRLTELITQGGRC